MNESPINQLPKRHPLRNAVAKEILEKRHIEKAGGYHTNRDSIEYTIKLLGIQCFFDYVRNLGTSNLVLDIGAGTTLGISELSQSSLGKGLRFEATVLSKDSEITRNLGDKKAHVAPVETLRGIPDKSIGGIIGVYSIAYSDAPTFAVGSMDRVLVPGGIIKATFRPNFQGNPSGLKLYVEFKKALQELDYDIATYDATIMLEEDVLLAIKLGGEKKVKAKDLLKADKKSAMQQVEILKKEEIARRTNLHAVK